MQAILLDRLHPVSWIAVTAAVVLSLAHLAAPTQSAVGWLAGGVLLAVTAAGWYEIDSRVQARLVPLTGAAFAVGLLLLPDDGRWAMWVATCGLAVLPISLPNTSISDRQRYGAATIIAALGGVLLAGDFATYGGSILAGLGVLMGGQALYVLLMPRPASPTDTTELQSVTAGDFTETQDMRIPILQSDDLLNLSMRLHVTVDGLVRAAHAIGEVTDQQTRGAAEQAEVINITNNNMDDFLELSERITERAREINKTSGQSIELADAGKASLTQAMEGMDHMRSQVKAIGTTIITLTQLTRRIDEIITSVSEIATQSNLLALNASIEAARAGVHGRGFAVVADEVRSLAGQSTQAASQVRSILAEIQSAVKQTVAATEAGMISADEGVMTIRKADKTMIQLADNVTSTQQAVRSIYEVIRQQANGLEEVGISVERIERITQQTLASTRMADTVSNNLGRLAEELQEAMALAPSDAPTQMVPDGE